MRILQINAVNKILSTGRSCYEMSQYLNTHGYECYIAYSTKSKTEKSFKISSTLECKYHALMSRITGKQGYFSLFSTNKLIRWMSKNKPDIVHLRLLHANYINIKTLLEYLSAQDIPTVVTLHDCWFFTGKCTHYVDIGCEKWKTGCFECPKLKQDHNSWFFDRTTLMWNDKFIGFRSIPRLAVVGVSNWITNEAKQSPIFEKAKSISCVYNWIDVNIFKPSNNNIKAELGIEHCKMILGVSSKWSKYKGLDKFLALSEKLNKNEKIVLVGKLPEMVLPRNVISVQATNNIQTLVDIYSAADVFLQLSPLETFGKVVVEALACGTPVVTNDKTANPELINEECGIVIHSCNADVIAKAVRQVLYGEYSSELCRKYVCDHFLYANQVEAYLNIYSQLLQS